MEQYQGNQLVMREQKKKEGVNYEQNKGKNLKDGIMAIFLEIQ